MHLTRDQYNEFCRGLPHTTHVVQWGGADVWKVGGKVFAVAGWSEPRKPLAVTFKVSATSYELLKDLPGVRPAPYLASRGMTWVQRTGPETLDDDALRDYLAASHGLVAGGLPKRVQAELGLSTLPTNVPIKPSPMHRTQAARRKGDSRSTDHAKGPRP